MKMSAFLSAPKDDFWRISFGDWQLEERISCVLEGWRWSIYCPGTAV